MSDRPANVRCIEGERGQGLCGRWGGGFLFVDAIHWARTMKHGSRLRGCPGCVAIVKAQAKEEGS